MVPKTSDILFPRTLENTTLLPPPYHPPRPTQPHTNPHKTTALVVVVPKDTLTTNGPIKKWKGIADSGNAVYRWFCSECGSPIAHEPEAAPVIALKGGCLDSEIKKTLKPDTEIWTVGKLPFCQEKLEKPFEHMPQH